jgi:hypothetical protein
MAHRLNPLSRENAEKYVTSLLLARHFHRLETFLFQQQKRDQYIYTLFLEDEKSMSLFTFRKRC